MAEYYSILLRAVTAPGSGDAQWRRGIYDRTRQMLASQMRAGRPQAPLTEVAAEQAALEAAIEQVEAELSRRDREALMGNRTADDRDSLISEEAWTGPDRPPLARPYRSMGPIWIVLAIAAAALGAGAYIYWAKPPQKLTSLVKSEAAAPTRQAARSSAAKDGDLAPGIDGGSSDADLPYVFRRQPVFYRTPQPIGTVIVDKPQRFLYLIAPNNVALRYGIGLGRNCAELAGLHRITGRAEWPPWQPPPDLIERKLAGPGVLAGGPGNPLGARVLELDDGQSRIHGTNAPKTIGGTVEFGCIRLANDDITDLYNRVHVSTPVIIED
jgi:lipoprotein-anchoring transpeptidase ErfK/SrfK